MHKQFYITKEMLGSVEGANILSTPLPEDIIRVLQTVVGKEDGAYGSLHTFLIHLSIVRSMLKENKADRITAASAQTAIKAAELLPQEVKLLLGPQIYSLMKTFQRMDVLSVFEYYLNSSVVWQVRGRDNNSGILETIVRLLERLNDAKNTMSQEDYLAVANILSSALVKITKPLFGSGNILGIPLCPVLNAFDLVFKEALDVLLTNNSQTSKEDIGKFIDSVTELGYSETELWSAKIIGIEKINCLLRQPLGELIEKGPRYVEELIDYAFFLCDDCASSILDDDNKRFRINVIERKMKELKQIKQRLEM